MKYLEVSLTTSPCNEITNDVLAAVLGEIGFDSFVNSEQGILAYIQQNKFDEMLLKKTLETFPLPDTDINYAIHTTEDKDWNEEWEKNYFQPIVIDNRCVIHSTFHKNVPQAEYDIVINPQMAFGTGHHQTTSLILNELLNLDLKNKSVLDMGCGTSILAILASMRGANPVTAIDIDDWCVENSKDNARLNHINNLQIELGCADSLQGREPFDIIIANINRNILLADMQSYVKVMHPGSVLYISGFYIEDIPLLREEAERLGLRFEHSNHKDNWADIKFIL